VGLLNHRHLCLHVSVRRVSLVVQFPFKIIGSFRSQTDPVILIFKSIENNVNMANAQTYQVGDMLCYLIFHRLIEWTICYVT
jgi:hypothetical protein